MESNQSPSQQSAPSRFPRELLFVALLFAVGMATLLFLKFDWVKATTLELAATFNLYSPPPQQITYYQWFDESGEVVISTEKPSQKTEYFSFQASSDLMSNDNRVDPDVIAKGNAYRNSLLAGNDTEQSENGATKPSNLGLINSFEKAKHCIEMAQKVAAVNRDLKEDKDSNQLREQHKKDCIDNFKVQ